MQAIIQMRIIAILMIFYFNTNTNTNINNNYINKTTAEATFLREDKEYSFFNNDNPFSEIEDFDYINNKYNNDWK